MKNKTLKLALIITASLLLSFLLTTSVKAEVIWDSDSKTVTITCGDTNTTLNLGDDGTNPLNIVDTSGTVHNADTYIISENEGASIFTGWNQPMWNNNNRSNYGIMNIKTDVLGQQTMTIQFTPGNGSTNPSTKTTELTINCVASDDLKTVIEALGGEMPNAYTINDENVYTSLDDLTGEQYEAILDTLDAEEEYNSLNNAEKAIADALMTEKLGMTAEQVLQAAKDGIERLADNFVDESRLNDESIDFEEIEDLEEAREILVNATTMGEKFDSLSPRTKERVLAKLSDENYEFNSWEEVVEVCNETIDEIDAALFIVDYIENTEDGLNEEKILEGEDPYNNSNDNVKELINEILTNVEGIEKTYPELLKRAKANKFLKDNLTTEDGKIIVEANNSNYKQILDAEDDYNELSDEIKEEVNKILTEEGDTTYPELLKYAQELAPTPKTGDMAVVMIAVLAVSAVGLAITFIKRKRK